MKKILLFACAMAASTALWAQVDTEGLTSEAPGSSKNCYIVCDNGYFLTSKGSRVFATATAPDVAEWTITTTDEGYYIKSGTRSLSWTSDGDGIELSETLHTWDIGTDYVSRTGCYSISSPISVNFYGEIMEDYDAITFYASGDNMTPLPWPASYSASKEKGLCRDLMFFATLPAQIDNRENSGDDEEDEIVEVPENNIESDFSTNWNRGMQDAKVLTYVPMDGDDVHLQYWMPVRNGVSSYHMTIFREDVVQQFYGNKVKNLWFMMPHNGQKLQFFIMDPMETDPDKYILWSDSYDFTEAVEYMRSQPDGIVDDVYGKSLNTALLKNKDLAYYNAGKIVPIPCDFEITKDHPNLQIGYTVTYPGEYKDNYINGVNANRGLKDGIWYNESYLLPTSRPYYAFLMGDDDPDKYDGKYEDYTDYQEPLKDEYKWSEHAGLFCYVETEGNGGFPHNDIRFDEVKVSRCYTDDAKVPINATFTNYGVDPILSASFDITIGDNTRTLKFRDGIKFLQQATLDDDLTPPSSPTREPMKIMIAKINGKEVNIPSNIDGEIVCIESKDDVQRMAVIEENTGTWCGWCPRGIVGMEKLRATFDEDVALIAIHSGMDSKANGMMDEVLGTFGATGAPSCVIGRKWVGDPYVGTNGTKFGIADDVRYIQQLITEASIDFPHVAVSDDLSRIAVSTATTFSLDCDECPYTLTYVITEDELTYATQANYYINRSQIDDATVAYYKENDPDLYALTQKPNPWIPTYYDVMQYCAAAMGIEGSLQGPIVRGEAKEHAFLINLPKDRSGKSVVTDINNCRLIALLLDKSSLEVVNAAQMRLDQAVVDSNDPLFAALANGIDTVLAPTPAENSTTYDLSGRAIAPARLITGGMNRIPVIADGRLVIGQ